MALRQASPQWLCAYLPFAPALVAAATLARVHEARQDFTSVASQLPPAGPRPVSLQTSLLTSTMPTPPTTSSSPTSTSSQPPSSPSSSVSSPLSTTSPDTPVTSSTHSASRTSSATPQPTTSSAALNFTVHNMTTCTSGLVSWNYGGNETELSLSITNIGVDQNQSGNTRANGTIQQQLAQTNTSASPWLWSSVNVPQGWYEIQGLALATPSVRSNSAPFFIANGTNVSCLLGTSPSSGASASSSPPTSASTTNVNVGAIAGGVVGGIVGVALAITAGVYLWLRRRKPWVVRADGSRSQKWGSLKSTDSNVEPGGSGSQLTGRHFHTNSESMAGVLEDAAGGNASTMTTPGDSDEDAVMTGEEKPVSPASSSGMSPFDVLNTPVHYDRRSSAHYSVQIPSPVVSDSSRSRSTSLQASGQTIEQQAQRIRSSMETSIRRRSERLSMPTIPHPPTHIQYKEEYPLSPVTATPVNRTISTSAVSVTRRGSRKPVPQFDPSLLLEDTSASSMSTVTGGADSSYSNGTGMGSGALGTPTDFVRKANFGDGRPVHYLIPDMPPSQED